MREILFRGKAINRDYGCHRTNYKNGDWVYGLVTRLYDERFENLPAEMTNVNGIEGIEVDYKTIGQYTGLTDKNGKKIFEGDMIKPFDDEIDKMVVEFCHGQFLLCLYGERGYMAEYGWEESGNYGCFEAEPLSSYGDDIEVIGNIHDNPELLGGNNNG